MPRWVMKVIHLTGIATQGRGAPGGMYVAHFDVEAHDGRGDVLLTRSRGEAHKFDSVADVFAAWNQQSLTRPLRADGMPNRPLRAFTVEPVLLEEE